MYTFWVIIHIISAGLLIGLIAMALIGSRQSKKVKGSAAELAWIRTVITLVPIMGNVGAGGILLSGVALTLMTYSFFPFSSLPWLALMQADFVLMEIIVLGALTPRGKKILAITNAELAGPNAAQGASDELRLLVAKQETLGIVMAILTVIAIALGESKAMMWVTGQ
ncbi:MAG TPA: hypothetical protein VFH95_02990 [Candidatus Kapabacteria bacterium]|nr:hypothetical protein [Candidatus Kapabacteria bacterium]